MRQPYTAAEFGIFSEFPLRWSHSGCDRVEKLLAGDSVV